MTTPFQYEREDPARVRTKAEEWAVHAARWPGDLWPTAVIEERVTAAAAANAWYDVAEMAAGYARRIRMGHQSPSRNGAALRKLTDEALALETPAHSAAVAARRAENASPPRAT